jgi:Protein of unknown function (DUF3228)
VFIVLSNGGHENCCLPQGHPADVNSRDFLSLPGHVCHRFETPMQPITVMRNALISEGGSGVAIDRAAYDRSVEYWSKHAPVA